MIMLKDFYCEVFSLCYNTTMIKKSLGKQRKNKKILIVAISLVALTVLAILAAVFLGEPAETSEVVSQRNTNLIQEARKAKDLSMCDRIQGGIKEIVGHSYMTPDGAIADAFGRRGMTESETRRFCVKAVNEALGR